MWYRSRRASNCACRVVCACRCRPVRWGVRAQLSDTFTNWSAHPAVGYGTRTPGDPIAVLNRKFESGALSVWTSGRSGYLRSTLEAPRYPRRITGAGLPVPTACRDSASARSTLAPSSSETMCRLHGCAAVSWKRRRRTRSWNRLLRARERGDIEAQFVRRQDCLQCHFSHETVGVPGMVDRGYGQLAVDHRTPFDKRWEAGASPGNQAPPSSR